MNAVDCKRITKSFGSGNTRVDVLRGVDFTAARGEMTFLVGPSGCGKTTLISIIAGCSLPMKERFPFLEKPSRSSPPMGRFSSGGRISASCSSNTTCCPR